jgi:hypothetical protein
MPLRLHSCRTLLKIARITFTRGVACHASQYCHYGIQVSRPTNPCLLGRNLKKGEKKKSAAENLEETRQEQNNVQNTESLVDLP